MVTRAKLVGPVGRVVLGCLCWLGLAASFCPWCCVGLGLVDELWRIPPLLVDWQDAINPVGVSMLLVLLGVPVAVISFALLGRRRRVWDWVGAGMSLVAPLVWYCGMWVIMDMIFG
jgi:hypothetical protein